jgi:hypothetical protein
MTDDRELDDGLAAFDRLGREMAETNRLLRDLQTSQKAREARESSLSADFQAALKQATGASQKALQAAQTEIRSSLLWTGLTGFLIVLTAFGGGYFFGHRAGSEKGRAEGYQTAHDEQARASWANTPAGQRAYALDLLGNLDLVAQCRGPGWKIERQHGQDYCYPYLDAQQMVHGWAIP